VLDLDTFLTVLCVMVDDFCKASLAAEVRPGPEASLSRSEVVTLAIFGQWGRFASERDFSRFAQAKLRGAFPRLPDRSQFNRLVRLHHDAIVAFGLCFAPQQTDYEALDTLPVTVRQYKRRGREWLAGQADIGFSKRIASWFCGFRLLAAVSPDGLVTGLGFGPASAKEQPLTDTLLALRHTPDARAPSLGAAKGGGCYVADKDFEGKNCRRRWHCRYGALLIHAPRRNRRHPWPPGLRRWLASLRQIVETVFANLTQAFRLDRERPHHLIGFSARLAAKVSLHNFCHWLNRSLGRPALAFADLLGW
jgi:hypothetical protein